MLASDVIVLRMATDPEPQDAVGRVDGQRAVVPTHTCTVEPADTFEMERGVLGIGVEELKLLICKGADCLWQLPIRAPKARGRIVGQSFWERPAR